MSGLKLEEFTLEIEHTFSRPGLREDIPEETLLRFGHCPKGGGGGQTRNKIIQERGRGAEGERGKTRGVADS